MKAMFSANIPNISTPVVAIIVASVVIVVALIVLYIRNRSIEGIREDVYQLFLKAEHLFVESGAGAEKMDWVCEKAYEMLPKVVKLFTTPDMIRVILQKWFVQIKDLLDDGKKNDSVESVENEE